MRSIGLILLVKSCTISSCTKHHDNSNPRGSNPTTPTTSTLKLTTTAVTNITDSTATSGGTITTTGTVSISIRGVQWDTSTRFTNSWSSSSGSGDGTFSSNLTGLMPSTSYDVRSYGVSANDTSYGDTLQFTTSYTPGKYTVTTIAGTGASGSMDGSASSATFHAPDGVTVDAAGNIYVADESDKIRKISGNTVSTLTNVPTGPSDVAVDSSGNIYVAMPLSYNILKVTPAGQLSTYISGLSNPVTLDIDPSGNLYVGDETAFRKVSPSAVGNIYVSDLVNKKIRKISPL